jgi:hypothetical protein
VKEPCKAGFFINLSMQTFQVSILNPKAAKLLQDLADLNLISIKQTGQNQFIKAVESLRTKASPNPPSLEEITKEVEAVRSKRHGKKG